MLTSLHFHEDHTILTFHGTNRRPLGGGGHRVVHNLVLDDHSRRQSAMPSSLLASDLQDKEIVDRSDLDFFQ